LILNCSFKIINLLYSVNKHKVTLCLDIVLLFHHLICH
jgi:hypothetical protein